MTHFCENILHSRNTIAYKNFAISDVDDIRRFIDLRSQTSEREVARKITRRRNDIVYQWDELKKEKKIACSVIYARKSQSRFSSKMTVAKRVRY